jgi:hypothetical protein
MLKKVLAVVAAALTVLTFSLPVLAQQIETPAKPEKQAEQRAPKESIRQKIADLEEQSKEALAAKKWVRYYSANMKLVMLVPYQPQYQINVVQACAMIGRKNTAYHFMHSLQQQGFNYDFDTMDDTVGIRDTEAYTYINQMLTDAGTPAGEAIPAFELPGNPANYRAFAWDSSRNRFLVGTLSDGALLSVSTGGEITELLKANDDNGLWSITGIDVDAGNNRLWISSAATPGFNGYTVADKGHGALFELNLQTLEVLGRYNVPVDGLVHELGGLAATEEGHVYVIDRKLPFIYQKKPEGTQLEVFFANPDMLGLVDIAVTPDNARLFVSDTTQGIMVIDPIAVQAAMLVVPDTLNLFGIAGLEYNQGQLFVIQGGFSPQRVIRLELDANGGEVAGVTPMAIALNEFNHPGLASIQGDSLYYVANAGLDEDTGAKVVSTPLAAGIEVAPPDIDKFTNAIKKKNQ